MSGFYSFITGAYSFINNFIFGRIIFQGIKFKSPYAWFMVLKN